MCHFLSSHMDDCSDRGSKEMIIHLIKCPSKLGTLTFKWQDHKRHRWAIEASRGSAEEPRLQHSHHSLPQTWLENCKKHHSNICDPRLEDLPLGFQLIDCVENQIVLVEHLQHRPQYLALSYVWGKHNEENKLAHNTSSLPIDLPRTIQDAVKATMDLGFRYLWVDRYCIRQDHKEEKHTQIKMMGAIYGSAEITLVDLDGTDANHGLPGVAESHSRSQDVLPLGDWMINIRQPMDLIASTFPVRKWSQRAWTFQEALLSHRRLVFTENMMMFQCSKSVAIEPELLSFGIDNDISPLFPWNRVGTRPDHIWKRIEEYSLKTLSYEEDALNAIEGILREFTALEIPTFTIWGVPILPMNTWTGWTTLDSDDLISDREEYQKCFLAGLHWVGAETGQRIAGNFPSWSWLCSDGWVTHPRPVYFPSKLMCDPRLWLMLKDGTQLSWDAMWTQDMRLQYETHDLLPILMLDVWMCPIHAISTITSKSLQGGRDWTFVNETGSTRVWVPGTDRVIYPAVYLDDEDSYTSVDQLARFQEDSKQGGLAGIICGMDSLFTLLLVKQRSAPLTSQWERIGGIRTEEDSNWAATYSKIGSRYSGKSKIEDYIASLFQADVLVRRTIELV